ncbi:MAG TPA: aminopeptidase P N-terminal domain-containing protein, partial [Bacilli bacterium]|nr:aminopeptidase P N-terminal domain-containing protein [Bacilli bacterium]
MEAGQFKKRRDQLIAQLEEDSGLLLFAGVPIKSSADGTYPFIANRNFEYMTGITQENSVLAIIKSKGEARTYLFIDEANPDKERWTGRLLAIEQARRISAIDDVLLTKNLMAKMEAIFGGEGIYGHVARVYLDLEPNIVIGPNYMHTSAFGAKLRELDATLEIKDVYLMIVRQRMIKSDAEVAAIRQAIRITGFGLNYIAAKLKPHLYEHQVEGL